MADVCAVASAIVNRNSVIEEGRKMTTSQRESRADIVLSLAHFNISGQKFVVSDELVRKYPESKLASPHLLNDHWVEDLKSFYFDRDPALFNSVLNVLRYNVLNVPSGYDKDLVMEEINFWQIPTDGVEGIYDDEESRLEAEFQWLENRIPPPPPNSSSLMKLRYKWWCFITDPLGPHTEHRMLSIAYSLFTIATVVLYMILYGLGTSAHFRIPDENAPPIKSLNTTNALDSATAAIGCSDLPKIECYLRSIPLPSILYLKHVLKICFILETIIRLLLCPGWAYFRSVINWIDIIAGVCAIAALIIEFIAISRNITGEAEMHVHYIIICFQSVQVLRIFKIFQYASLIDGLMIMMLTIKACIKELSLLVMYLMIAMFVFATTVSFLELESNTGVGIPDCIYGYWWAIITMTTVGYGDYYPTTVGGYFIGVLCAISGLILTALPVAIIGSNFNVYWEHNRKRRRLLMAAIKKERSKRKKIKDVQ